ncbi:hypothetical protein D6777_00835 [Candidatus Woesearchaeota archaeon]|nr:MAG: hypothetical protein D6777_00835 [Candidatus Woesearchaeota archaeon]
MIKNKWYKGEVKDLVKSWVVLSLAFAIVITGPKFNLDLLLNLVFSALTVGVGFLMHELAHKMVAQKYRLKAVYKSDPIMLGVALVSSLFGFLFAAPGAVYIIGSIRKKDNGKISLAGPVTNIILAIMFLILFVINQNEIVKSITMLGFFVNSWLAAFNLIPFGMFDGRKILEWNKVVYGVTLVIAVGLIFLRYLL